MAGFFSLALFSLAALYIAALIPSRDSNTIGLCALLRDYAGSENVSATFN
jgi:hypothetical protein